MGFFKELGPSHNKALADGSDPSGISGKSDVSLGRLKPHWNPMLHAVDDLVLMLHLTLQPGELDIFFGDPGFQAVQPAEGGP